jgi:hypothetical protein
MAAVDTMILANIHLRRAQKLALQRRAKTHGTNLAEEIRNAVDAYLDGISAEDLALLNKATIQAQTMLMEMSESLAATNRKADKVFQELEKLRSAKGA